MNITALRNAQRNAQGNAQRAHRVLRLLHSPRSPMRVATAARQLHCPSALLTSRRRCVSTGASVVASLSFEDHYNIRSNLQALIHDYANRDIPPLSFEFLTQHRPPLTNEQVYQLNLQLVNYMLSCTCRQLTALQELPYIAVLNPKVEQTHALYLKTLKSLLSNNFPYDLYNREKMHSVLAEFLDDHQDTLQTLSDGMTEIMQHFPRDAAFAFLNDHLRNRITMKLLATHYLALLEQPHGNANANANANATGPTRIGIIQRDVRLSSFISRIFEFVNDLCLLKYDHQPIRIKYTAGKDVTFTCIPIIVEYVMTEILKNSMRATIERAAAAEEEGGLPHSPDGNRDIEVSIFEAAPNSVVMRVRDYGGGIPPHIESKIFDYSYTSTTDASAASPGETHGPTCTARDIDDIHSSAADDQMLPGETVHNIAGMGFGLPLCKTYLELFGGKIDIQSLRGLGTDVYITLTGPTDRMLGESK